MTISHSNMPVSEFLLVTLHEKNSKLLYNERIETLLDRRRDGGAIRLHLVCLFLPCRYRRQDSLPS